MGRRRRPGAVNPSQFPQGRTLLLHEVAAACLALGRPFKLDDFCRRLLLGRNNPFTRRTIRKHLTMYVRAGLVLATGGRPRHPLTYVPFDVDPEDLTDEQRAARDTIAARRELWLRHYNRGRDFFEGLL